MKSHREQSDESKRTGEAPETMTRRDAAMFPIIASCALFGLYVFFQVSLSVKILHVIVITLLLIRIPSTKHSDISTYPPVY